MSSWGSTGLGGGGSAVKKGLLLLVFKPKAEILSVRLKGFLS